jgi:2,6-dihydroxypseudooxynicotine hydrolase
MSDEATRQGIRSILNPGRMSSDGIPQADFQQAIERVTTLDEWFDFWARKGEEYELLGDESVAAGNTVSGGEWLWHAALSFHYAQFMSFHDPARREAGQRRKVELYNRAAPYLVPLGERVEIPFEDATIPGFLRMPPGEPPAAGWPCVLLIGGLESTKEESLLFENMCLRRGLATFAFDGPGQGELFFEVKLQPDFERYASAVVDSLEQRPELDRRRFGVLGRSLGGFYALRAAATDDRIRACVAWGFFYDMSDFESMPAHTQRGFVYVTGREGIDGRDYLRESLCLSDVASKLRTPTLLLNGANDPIFPSRQTNLVGDALRDGPTEFVIEPLGDHCCHNMGQIVRPRMADWIANELQRV